MHSTPLTRTAREPVADPLSLETAIIHKTLRVPRVINPLFVGKPGGSDHVARQVDVVLMSAGVKASGQLLTYLGDLEPGVAMDAAVRALGAVRSMLGDHVQHNPYFLGFPGAVPSTVDFWWSCVQEVLRDPATAITVITHAAYGQVNLLALPTYGRVQHSFTELIQAHSEFAPSTKDRLTVLHLGGTLTEEAHRLYMTLAGSSVPLSAGDLDLLWGLTAWCLEGPHPGEVPVRENRAVLNAARLARGAPLLHIDTVTDVLRTAVAASDGDVTLSTPCRFASLPKAQRRALRTALHDVLTADPTKIADVGRYREEWKRLGEYLHPHTDPSEHVRDVFVVARGERQARSLASRVEHAFDAAEPDRAATLLARAPGMLFRSLDRLLRAGADPNHVTQLVLECAGGVSGRVLLSVVEHLNNRARPHAGRLFINQHGRAWSTPDTRRPLDSTVTDTVADMIGTELMSRVPAVPYLAVDPAVREVAIPLTGKATPGGFRVMPRGSLAPVMGNSLRFFIHWREATEATDYDLSVQLLDEEYRTVSHLSWTQLTTVGGAHSGDLTEAPGPEGSSELINLYLPELSKRVHHIVPQVHLYRGEAFADAAESFFGWMTMDREQAGMPFDPRAVRMRSDLRVPGRVALPLVFSREEGGGWWAKWAHLHMNGFPDFNTTEEHRVAASVLVRGIVERQYVRMDDLISLMAVKADRVTRLRAGEKLAPTHPPVTFIGIDRPEDLPTGSEVFTLDRLAELIPR